jgi:hypothetical protein
MGRIHTDVDVRNVKVVLLGHCGSRGAHHVTVAGSRNEEHSVQVLVVDVK